MRRRDFLKATAATAFFAGSAGRLLAQAAKKSATDLVPLGNSGIKVTRLAFGTGTNGGRIQRELGQEEFTRLVRHAYDRGIRFFETAETYDQMPERLGIALKGIPRDSYRLMTKVRWNKVDDPRPAIEGQLKALNTDHVDILLLHCVRTLGWPKELERQRDILSEAKSKKTILAHGASCHGLLPLRAFPGTKWLDTALLRVNHDGTMMDNLAGDAQTKGDVSEVSGHIAKIRAQGTGVIGMKLMGEGRFTNPADREASLKYVLKLGAVDAVTIGYKTTAEIDEAIARINGLLNA